MIRELNTSRELINLALGIYLIGYAIGPLFLAPFSEYIGRYPVYVISYFICKLYLFIEVIKIKI